MNCRASASSDVNENLNQLKNEQKLLNPINELEKLRPYLSYEYKYSANLHMNIRYSCKVTLNYQSYIGLGENFISAKNKCVYQVLKIYYPKTYKQFSGEYLSKIQQRIEDFRKILRNEKFVENSVVGIFTRLNPGVIENGCLYKRFVFQMEGVRGIGTTEMKAKEMACKILFKMLHDFDIDILIQENEAVTFSKKNQCLINDNINEALQQVKTLTNLNQNAGYSDQKIISDNENYGPINELLKLRPEVKCIETIHPANKRTTRYSCEIIIDNKSYKRFRQTINRAKKTCAQLVLRELYPEIYKNKDQTDVEKLNTEKNKTTEQYIDKAFNNTPENISYIQTLMATNVIDTDLPTPSQEIEAQETTKDSFGEIKQLMSSIDSIMEIETIEKLIEDQLKNNIELNESNANLLITLYKSTNHIWPIHGRNPESIQLNILSLLFDYLNKHRIHPELIADYIIALSDAVKAKTTNINLIQDLIHRLNKLVTVIQINEFKEIIYHEDLLPVLMDILKNKRISAETNECCADLLLKLSDNIKVRSFLRRNQKQNS